MSDLYERDALAWAEQQSALLDRLAAGERLNEAVDWPNVIGEVRDVGLAQLTACRSLLRQAMLHLLKLHTWPNGSAASHWRGEARTFLLDAGDRFTPSMRQRIDLDRLYVQALSLMREDVDVDVDSEARRLPATCPFTLDELLDAEAGVSALIAKLSTHSSDPTVP